MTSQNNAQHIKIFFLLLPDHCCPPLDTAPSAGGGISSFGSCCNVFREMSVFAVTDGIHAN